MVRDLRAESWLDREGISGWVYMEAVRLSDFDERASLENMGRIGKPVNEDLVIDYALFMRQGSEFPALIAYRNAAGKWVIIAGNHRYQAAKLAERETFDIYAVPLVDPGVIERLSRTENANGAGWRPSREEMIEHGKQLVISLNYTQQAAAAKVGVPEHILSQAIHHTETLQRLHAAGRDTRNVPKTSLVRLGALSSDRVLLAAFDLAKEAKLSTPDVDRLVTEVRKRRNETDQLAAIAAWRAVPAVERRIAEKSKGTVETKPVYNPGSYLSRAINTIIGLAVRYPTLGALRLTEHDRKREVWTDWLQAQSRVEAIFHEFRSNGFQPGAEGTAPPGGVDHR